MHTEQQQYPQYPFKAAYDDLSEAGVWLKSLCADHKSPERIQVTPQVQIDQALFHINRAIETLGDVGMTCNLVGHNELESVGRAPVVNIAIRDDQALDAAQALEAAARTLRRAWRDSADDRLPADAVARLMLVLPTQFGDRLIAEGVMPPAGSPHMVH